MKIKDWNIYEMTGYKPKTTFYQDFSIADAFGADAIRETYGRAFDQWKTDYIYLTEFVMVLNWKIWEHYETNKELAEVYNELFHQADAYAVEHLEGQELQYFYKTTD